MGNLRKGWNIFSSILMGLGVLLAVLLVGVRLFGVQIYTVLSGSMEPTYHTGALLYVKEADPLKLEAGDVITFKLEGTTIATHRIVEVISSSGTGGVCFRTKGDANDMEDGSLVKGEDVLGKPFFSIPYLGFLASYIQQPPGMYIAICIACAVLLLLILPEIFMDSEPEDEPEKKKRRKKKRRRSKKRKKTKTRRSSV